jgi:hypothetical protein
MNPQDSTIGEGTTPRLDQLARLASVSGLTRSVSHDSLPGELEHPSQANREHALPTIHTHPQYIPVVDQNGQRRWKSWLSLSPNYKEHQDGDRRPPSRWKAKLPRWIGMIVVVIFTANLFTYYNLLPSLPSHVEPPHIKREEFDTPKSSLLLHLENTAREAGIDLFSKTPIVLQSSSAAEKKLAPWFQESVSGHLPNGKRYMLYMYHSGTNCILRIV